MNLPLREISYALYACLLTTIWSYMVSMYQL